MQKYLVPALCSLFLGLLPAACAAGHAPGAAKHLAGTVTYRERMALPPDAELLVILDSRTPSGDAVRVAEVRVPANGRSVPLPFEIQYTPDAGNVYSLQARILEKGGEVLFATPEPLPVPDDDTTLVVMTRRVFSDSAVSAREDDGQKPHPDPAGLTGTRWKLALLHGRKAEVFDNQPEVHLVFHPEGDAGGRISGSDGCNAVLGTYTAEGGVLRFSHLGGTLMLCPKGDAQAQEFTRMLGSVTGWTLSGDRLELLSDNAVQAVFARVPLK